MIVLAKNEIAGACDVSSLHVYIIIPYDSKVWFFGLHGSSCYHSIIKRVVSVVVQSMDICFSIEMKNRLLAFCPYHHVTFLF